MASGVFESNLFEPLLDDDWTLLSDDLDGVFADGSSSLGVENDEAWETAHFEVSGCGLHAAVLKRESEPWHLSEVLVVEVLVLIA